MKEKRNLTQIIKDVGVGLLCTGAGVASYITDHILISDTIDFVKENSFQSQPATPFVVTVSGAIALGLAATTVIYTISGIRKILGYASSTNKEQDKQYNSLDEDVTEINRNYSGFEHKKINLLNNLPAEYQDLE